MTQEQNTGHGADRQGAPAAVPAGYFLPLPQQQAQEDEIDLREIFSVLKASWKVIAVSVIVVTLVAGLYAFLTPKRYKADTLIAPLDNTNGGGGGGMAAALSQFGGLASLAGVSLGGDSDKDIAIATLQSRDLIMGLIRDKNLLPILFADRWNEAKKAWDVSSPEEVPSLLKAEDYFSKQILKVSEDKKTGLVTVEITWTDPVLAADWANELVHRANAALQNKALTESDHHLAFLQRQLQETSLVDMRQSIFTLMETELKNAMVAKGNDQYAFKVIDPAVVPEIKSWPKRGLILVLGFMAGLFLSSVGVLIHHSMRADDRSRQSS